MSGRAATVTPIDATAAAAIPRSRIRRETEEKLTLAELCSELQIARSTFYDWRSKGRAPRCIRLPNGDLRIRRHDLDAWLEGLAEPTP